MNNNNNEKELTKNINPKLVQYNLQELTKQISFYEDDHVYYYKGNKCISTTQLLKKFKTPFEQYHIATNCSQKESSPYYGMSVKSILKQWKDARDDSCDKGTQLHKYVELKSLNVPVVFVPRKDLSNHIVQANTFIETESILTKTILTEVILFHPDLLLAGMIDLIVINDDGSITIYDYKTNKEDITNNNPYNKFMKYCLKHIAETDFNVYSLQLSIYKAILEYHKFNIRDMYLVHIKQDKYKIIQCKNYDKEVKEIFNNILV